MKCGPSNNILIQLATFSFLQNLIISHNFLAFTTNTELQNFLCFFTSYKFDDLTFIDLAGEMTYMMLVAEEQELT